MEIERTRVEELPRWRKEKTCCWKRSRDSEIKIKWTKQERSTEVRVTKIVRTLKIKRTQTQRRRKQKKAIRILRIDWNDLKIIVIGSGEKKIGNGEKRWREKRILSVTVKIEIIRDWIKKIGKGKKDLWS